MQSDNHPTTNSEVAQLAPRLLSVSSAVKYSATSRAKLYQEMKGGNLKFIKLDGATRIEVSEINRWIDAKAEQSKAA